VLKIYGKKYINIASHYFSVILFVVKKIQNLKNSIWIEADEVSLNLSIFLHKVANTIGDSPIFLLLKKNLQIRLPYYDTFFSYFT